MAKRRLVIEIDHNKKEETCDIWLNGRWKFTVSTADRRQYAKRLEDRLRSALDEAVDALEMEDGMPLE